jgi:hypothetical protein
MRMKTIALALGTLLVVALPATAQTPLNAIISLDDPAGNTGDARVRVVHAVPDAPNVDVLVNDGVAFADAPFEGITPFAGLPAGTYNIKVVPAGATEPVVFEADLAFEADTDYTVIATGFLADFTPIILTADGTLPDAGNAHVRFFHGSPDAPAVDIAVTNGPVLFPNVEFRSGTDYAPVPAGSYDLEARIAGTETVALALPGVVLEDGVVYTVYATGLVADIPSEPELTNFYFVPGVARAGGVGDSFFLTDLDVQNAGDMTATYQFLWLPRDADNSAPIASEMFMLAPGSAARYSDLLGGVFGVEDGTNALGAIALISDSEDLLGFARTFNQSETGTFGQALPMLAASDLIMTGEKKRILYFTQNADFRSNIGLLNGNGTPVTIMWERFTADGMMVDASSAEIPAWGNVQLNAVFAGEAPVEGAYIDVWTETEGGAFTAYGSVLDNLTDDPTTVLPQ